MGYKKTKRVEIFPDEILMDSANLQNFDTIRMEGKIEKPLKKRAFYGILVFFEIIILVFFLKVFQLQIIQGENLKNRSVSNSLKKTFLFPPRGVIYDRNGKEVVWNGAVFEIISEQPDGKEIVIDSVSEWKEAEELKQKYEKENKYNYIRIETASSRKYFEQPGLSHILGYTGRPSVKDLAKKEDVPLEQPVGKEGLEKVYDSTLQGTVGIKLLEKNSKGEIVSENIQEDPKPGEKITLSIDADVQSQLFSSIKNVSEKFGYQGGSGIILDINSGEVLSLTSYPEYDSNIMSRGTPKEKISGFFKDNQKPFMNRAVSGLYAPGSIIKPAIALAALNEKILSPDKKIFSSGSISIPNPYNPEMPTIFKDWKAHGWTDMREALKVSSDVYFYVVGGGYEGSKGLGINKIKEYVERFGFGIKTGIDLQGEEYGTVPSPEMKKKIEPKDPTWKVGDTYNSSIGQGFFHITPIEMATYASALANNGKILKPHLTKTELDEIEVIRDVEIPEQYFKIIKEGMRMCASEGGTAAILNVPYVKIAAKTGTAEIGAAKKYVNSWVIGFFPYEKPRYAFALVMEKGPHENTPSASFVMRQALDWMSINKPEYFNVN